MMSDVEARRIEQSTGLPLRKVDLDLVCPYLTDKGRCSIYDLRPLICRMFGTVEGMPCPHGCKAALLTDKQSAVLFKQLLDEDRVVRSTLPKGIYEGVPVS